MTMKNQSSEGGNQMNHLLQWGPLDAYRTHFSPIHKSNCEKYIASLAEKSGINPDANKAVINSLRSKELDSKKVRRLRVLCIIGLIIIGHMVAIGLVGVIFISTGYVPAKLNYMLVFPPLLVLGLVGAYFLLKARKHLCGQIKGLEDDVETLRKQASKQMKPFNKLMLRDSSMYLLKKSLPFIGFDKIFSDARLNQLCNFGFDTQGRESCSSLMVQSGHIATNPFFIATDLKYRPSTATYTGSLDIDWDTQEKDKDGNVRSVRKTQTLTASITNFYPRYTEETYLFYGHDAAANCTFSRKPTTLPGASLKAKKKVIKKNERKLAAKGRDAVKKGNVFVPLGNAQFESLFWAMDRTAEKEFRMLFSSSAQKNITEILMEEDLGGDTFSFEKKSFGKGQQVYKITQAQAKHNLCLYKEPKAPKEISFEKAAESFQNYNMEFFKQMYALFAPILSIPLLCEPSTAMTEIQSKQDSTLPCEYVLEEICNRMASEFNFNPASNTRNILKARVVKCEKNSHGIDVITAVITATGYESYSTTEYVTVRGDDGNDHQVEVQAEEYNCVSRETTICFYYVADTHSSDYQECLEAASRNILDEAKIFNLENYLVWM